MHERSVLVARADVSSERPSVTNGRRLRGGIAPVARASWPPDREQTRNAGGQLAEIGADDSRFVAGDDLPDRAWPQGSGSRGNENVGQLGGPQAVENLE